MWRRTLLSALAGGTVGLAGCSIRWGPRERSPGAPGTQTEQSTDDTTTAPTLQTGPAGEETAPPGVVQSPGGSFGSATVVDLETVPRTYALRPDSYRPVDGVTVTMAFDRPSTTAHPARLAVRLASTRDDDVVLAADRLPVVTDPVARQPPQYDDAASLLFAPAEPNDIADTVPDVRRGSDGDWRAAGDTDPSSWLPDLVHLAPWAERRCDSVVVGHPDGTGRPTGDYAVGSDTVGCNCLPVISGPDRRSPVIEYNRPYDGTAFLSVWNTERPGPDGTSRFEGRGTLSIHEVDANVSWYHTATDGTEVYLEPSTERTSFPASVDFVAVNHSSETLSCGHWTVYKRVDGQFYHLWPDERTATCRTLAPGATKTFRLRAYHGVPPSESAVGRGAVRGHLGGGTYAVVAGYDDANETSGALVELVGDPVPVTPTDGVHATHVGNAVFVTATRQVLIDQSPRATVTLTPSDDASLRLIPEQVLRPRNRILRNTLPYLRDGVERVVLNTTTGVARRTLGPSTDRKRFAFDGSTYRIVLSTTEA